MSTQQRSKIVSIGDEETSLGFKLAGISEVFTEEPDKSAPLLRTLSEDPELAILIVTEEVAKANKDLIRRMRAEPYPVIIEVPGKKAKYESAEDKVRALIKMALGIDIEM
ncbi:MAG: V-type ATP synthase subunit F [Candidatus Heimdallarchaeota archaeon]|nr:V-type ATP synthase subunit F [Candidatus Heimdallarchaeota archaeon]MCK4954391.1 V-type ATP synthase subunit F [Candidatus Heimdallarchaeota archaeon]